ncbi:DUF1707 domain-containing protein [Actinomycetospora endophytica]|uniref:DUF1707 domain-containing protein n=1 Tax=Actinomycetospora endophytica TaxID=2291215 RepID=A0ABS8PAF8_9PSEU|nr:DUF1707 domain-containing protein [Actinomycetospora endophytica]MCD2195250.1 DUF1707 domain-containing protein [Actinomycetospora endophytica]
MTQPEAGVRSAGLTSRLRASDAERERTVRQVHRAVGEGRLDLPEMETRVAAAYGAVYRDELPGLLNDLPQRDSTPDALWGGAEAPTWRALWIALVWRVRASLSDTPDASRRGVPPGHRRQILAATVAALAALWFLICAVVGATT